MKNLKSQSLKERCTNCFESLDGEGKCSSFSAHNRITRSPLALTQGSILNGN